MIGPGVCICKARAIDCARDDEKISRRDRRRDWRGRDRAAAGDGAARISGGGSAAAGFAAIGGAANSNSADDEYDVEALGEDSFAGIDLAFFSAGSGTTKQFAPFAQAAGAVVIDNSSAFRMDPEVPLVIPEINPDDARDHRGFIANPNCTTAVALMALYPLHRAFGLRRIFASSYQAVSGTGARAIEELKQQVEASARGEDGGAGSLSASDRLQCAAARRFAFSRTATPRKK